MDRNRTIIAVSEYVYILESCLSEWLGHDIPAEGEDDYESWQERKAAIEGIETVEDAYEVAETFFGEPCDVFECLFNDDE